MDRLVADWIRDHLGKTFKICGNLSNWEIQHENYMA